MQLQVRALNGSNDNPTMQQMSSCLRKITTTNEIRSSDLANCKDSLTILTVSSSQKTAPVQNQIKPVIESDQIDEMPDYVLEDEAERDNLDHSLVNDVQDQSNPGKFEDISVGFTAGVIEKKIQGSRIACDGCGPVLGNIFEVNAKVDGLFVEGPTSQKPTKSTFDICECAHRIFNRYLRNGFDFNYETVLKDIYKELSNVLLFEESDFSHDMEHKRHLIGFITDEYLRMHATYAAKCLTLNEQAKMYRNYLKKQIHFHGQ